MQADVQRMFTDPNLVNGGVRIIPNNSGELHFSHHTWVSSGRRGRQYTPARSGGLHRRFQAYTFRLQCPPIRISSSWQSILIPIRVNPALSHAGEPDAANERDAGSRTDELEDNWGVGGPISIFYQFILGDGNNFTFVWHNTTGPLKEGAGSDPGLPSPAIGAKLFAIMDSLPQTDVELGSMVALGVNTNGVRTEFSTINTFGRWSTSRSMRPTQPRSARPFAIRRPIYRHSWRRTHPPSGEPVDGRSS